MIPFLHHFFFSSLTFSNSLSLRKLSWFHFFRYSINPFLLFHVDPFPEYLWSAPHNKHLLMCFILFYCYFWYVYLLTFSRKNVPIAPNTLLITWKILNQYLLGFLIHSLLLFVYMPIQALFLSSVLYNQYQTLPPIH